MLDSTPALECATPSDGGADPRPDPQTRRLAHDVVARFVRDPSAFAEAARVADPAAFLADYRRGVDRRLTALGGAPKKSGDRLATLGAPWEAALPIEGDKLAPGADLAPRMGPVVVAAAVVSAVSAVVTAVTSVVQAYTAVTKRKPL